MRNLYFFSHANDTHNEVKFLGIFADNKPAKAYEYIGLYWTICEIMHKEDGFLYKKDIKAFALKMHISAEKLQKTLEYFVQIELIEYEDKEKRFYSSRLTDDNRIYYFEGKGGEE